MEKAAAYDTISLKVSPKTSLVDEPVTIQVWGLQPQQRITLRAWLKDETGHIFYSRAFYISDKKGKVDLEYSPATGGDFQGLYPMGLFWALKSSIPMQRLIKNDRMGSPLRIHLEVYIHLVMNPFPETPPATTTSVERWFATPGLQEIEVRHGRIRGALLLPPGEGPFPGVIDIFGPVGASIDIRPFLLASRGFAVLSLAYFDYDDLPKSPDHVDLNYFEEAANFLVNHPKVSSAGVGVVGLAKGAEIALAMACFIPQIVATVCINGTICVSGQDLRYGDLTIRGLPHHEVKHLIDHKDDPHYLANLDSVLPIERAKCPIFFLVGENDQFQTSMFYAELSQIRAFVLGKKDVYLRSFPGAGHILEPPGYPSCLVLVNLSMDSIGLWGGELMCHCKAQEMSWQETLHFFHSYIPRSQPNK
ncbi:acyl-coenzyme A amino acid N-acyltransferase 1-like [Leptodactylus fuscus]|uniref:acyl-coenzyme A amino acid N-acyltransferase 1-like n=1 Tax=Leptodactylus fuscus TaxID=238119 RepID=UPI003F4F213E